MSNPYNHFNQSGASMFSQVSVTARALRSKFTVALENHDQAHRFYQLTNPTPRQLNVLEDLFAHNPSRVDARVTAPVVAGIVAPSAAPTTHGAVPIIGGWRSRRFVFEIEVEVSDGVNHPTIEVISGYTNMDETSLSYQSNSFDPNLALYINDMMTRSRISYQGPQGVTTTDRVSQGSSLVVPSLDPHAAFKHPRLYTARPEDMFSHVANKEVFSTNAEDNLINQATAMMPITSNVMNNSSSHYFSRLLNGIQAVQDEMDNMGSTHHQLTGLKDDHYDSPYRSGATSVKDSTYTSYSMSDLLNQTGFRTYGFVTWRELCQLIPNLDAVTVIFRSDVTDINGLNANHWMGSNPETQVAFSMCQSLKALCMMMQVSEVAFTMTNQTELGQPVFTYTMMSHNELDQMGLRGHNPFMVLTNGQAVTPVLLERFKSQVLDVLWPEISRNNTRTLFATVRFSLTVNTRVEVSWDGGIPTPYVFPNFSSSILSPLVTTDLHHAADLATGMVSMLSTVSQRSLDRAQTSSLTKLV